MNKIYTYENKMRCTHCMWVTGIYDNNPKIPKIGEPFFKIESGFERTGADVFLSQNKFRYSFQVVLQDHLSNDLHSLLADTLLVVDKLKKDYGMKDVRILVNNPYKKKLGEREHLHSFITMDSEESKDIYDHVFNTKNGVSRKTKEEILTIASQPYDTDPYYEFDNEETADLFVEDDVYRYLSKLTGNTIDDTTSLFIFIKISCNTDSRSCIGGELKSKIVIL